MASNLTSTLCCALIGNIKLHNIMLLERRINLVCDIYYSGIGHGRGMAKILGNITELVNFMPRCCQV